MTRPPRIIRPGDLVWCTFPTNGPARRGVVVTARQHGPDEAPAFTCGVVITHDGERALDIPQLVVSIIHSDWLKPREASC